MLLLYSAIILFAVTALFLFTWFLGEEGRYHRKEISAAMYYGVGLSVGGVLLLISIITLIFAIHSMRESKKSVKTNELPALSRNPSYVAK